LFDKYIQQGAAASYYALSTGTHVRVGTNIEQASANWLSERLAKNPAPDLSGRAAFPLSENVRKTGCCEE